MPFSQEKLDQVRAGIERSLASSSLNEWERKFLQGMQAKLDRYLAGMMVRSGREIFHFLKSGYLKAFLDAFVDEI